MENNFITNFLTPINEDESTFEKKLFQGYLNLKKTKEQLEKQIDDISKKYEKCKGMKESDFSNDSEVVYEFMSISNSSINLSKDIFEKILRIEYEYLDVLDEVLSILNDFLNKKPLFDFKKLNKIENVDNPKEVSITILRSILKIDKSLMIPSQYIDSKKILQDIFENYEKMDKLNNEYKVLSNKNLLYKELLDIDNGDKKCPIM